MPSTETPTEWYRDQYLVSTNPSLLQPEAINAAFDSEMMYWTRPIDLSLLQKLLNNSLCFGVYLLPQSTVEIAGKSAPKQIGLARLITDYVFFAYLTDVYILPEYQSHGLGKWLISCVNTTVSSWPELKRLMLISSGEAKLYKEGLGMNIFGPEVKGDGQELLVWTRRGSGSVLGV